MNISAAFVTLVVSVILPALTALVTKAHASAGIKQFITALFSAAAGLLITATTLDGTAVISRPAALIALGTFLASQAAYLGLWQPHALNAKVAPGAGLGGASPPSS